MLALTRRVGEEVVIGDPDHPLGMIRVVDIHGDKVRLAFDFPRDVQINRSELADEKRRSRDRDDETGDDKDNPGNSTDSKDDDSDNGGEDEPPDPNGGDDLPPDKQD